MRDLLGAAECRRHSPCVAGHEPNWPTHLACDAISHFGTVDGRSRVAGRLASDRYLVIEFRGLFRSIESDEKFWSFVFLDTDSRRSRATVVDDDLHTASASIAWCGEAAGERAKRIGSQFLLLDFFVVDIAKLDRHVMVGYSSVFVFVGIREQADAFELDCLARTVEGSVGEQDVLDEVGWLVLLGVGALFILNSEFLAIG